MSKIPVSFDLNGAEIGEFIESGTTLLTLLRDKLALTATKGGCNQGTCGACTVLIDDAPQLSCLVLAARCEGKSVTTLEGVIANGALHPLQQAFVEGFATQCGFCTLRHDHGREGAPVGQSKIPTAPRSSRPFRAMSAAAPAMNPSSMPSWRPRRAWANH